MTVRCAQVLNATVTNVIIADPDEFQPDDGSVLVQSDTAQIGWTYANGTFTPVVAPTVPQTQNLTFIQFMNLFTSSEQTLIMNSTDTQVKLFCFQCASTDNINLTDNRITQGVSYLVAVGLVTSARALIILSGQAPS